MVTINVTTGATPAGVFAGLTANSTFDIAVDAAWYSATQVAIRNAAGTALTVFTVGTAAGQVTVNSVRSAPQPRSRS